MRFGELFEKAKEEGALQSLIPDGDFQLECTHANGNTSKEGVDRIGLLWKVKANSDGSPLDDEDPAHNASGWQNLSFSEKAAAISMRQLKALGLTDEFLASSESPEEVAEACIGIVIDASVGHRNWGKDGENTSNDFKVAEVLVPPVLPEVEAQFKTGNEESF